MSGGWANYQGHDGELSAVVVFPDAAEGINVERRKNGLAPIEVAPLQYGLAEVNEIVLSLNARLLAGPKATILGLIDALKDGTDILYVISHGEEKGFYLNDGLVVASELTSLVRSSGAFLTILNTCSSSKVAEIVALELGTAVIATVEEVPDRQALLTGILFCQHLAAGYDYVTAYELAKPGQNRVYVLIEARTDMSDRQGRQPRDQRPAPYTRAPMPIDNETLTRFIAIVEDLDVIVNGSTRLGLAPLKDTVANLQGQLNNLAPLKDSFVAMTRELGLIKAQFGEIQIQLANSRNERRTSRVTIIVEAVAIVLLVITVIVLSLKLGGIF